MKLSLNTLPKFVTSVNDKLYRGKAVCCPYRLYRMKQNGINQIIDLRNNFSIKKIMEKLFCKMLGIKYINKNYPHRLNTLPSETFFKEICDFINNNPLNTYLHCQYGKRRTGVTVAYYRIHHTDEPKNNILNNLIHTDFKDINKKTKRAKKYRKILTEFINTYFPESKMITDRINQGSINS